MEFNRKIYIMPQKIAPRRFFTADCHFNHKNIMGYENRPFKDVEEMNNRLIFNHNSMVKDEDICYNLGDLYFKGGIQAGNQHYYEFLKQMNGRIVIVKGNHDGKSNKIIDSIQSCIMYISGIKILCVHDPINATTNYPLILCGHVHSAFKIAELQEKNKKSLIINVGVDVWSYKPVEWRRIYELYEQWRVGKIKAPLYDKEAVQKIREERRIQRKENLRG